MTLLAIFVGGSSACSNWGGMETLNVQNHVSSTNSEWCLGATQLIQNRDLDSPHVGVCFFEGTPAPPPKSVPFQFNVCCGPRTGAQEIELQATDFWASNLPPPPQRWRPPTGASLGAKPSVGRWRPTARAQSPRRRRWACASSPLRLGGISSERFSGTNSLSNFFYPSSLRYGSTRVLGFHGEH